MYALQRHLPRQEFREMTKTTDESGVIRSPALQMLDYRPSALCNFKCRMCNSSSSSSIFTEETGEKYVALNSPFGKMMMQNALADLDTVRVNGGEPLLMQEFWEILDIMMKNSSGKRLCFNTNASTTTYKSKSIFDFIKHFTTVIGISIDDIGKRAEYIRHGTNWDKIEANIEKYINFESENVNAAFSSVVSVYNVLYYHELLEKYSERIIISILACYNPGWMNIGILPKHIKEQCKENLYKYVSRKNVNNLQCILNHLDSTPADLLNLRQQFVTNTKALDAKRNENFVETFPELACMFDDRFITDIDY